MEYCVCAAAREKAAATIRTMKKAVITRSRREKFVSTNFDSSMLAKSHGFD